MRLKTLILVILLATVGVFGQNGLTSSPRDSMTFSWSEESMPRALPNLVEIAMITKFFLNFEEDLGFSGEQREQLEQIYFDHERQLIQSSAEFQLAYSELNALLSRSSVDMKAMQKVVATKERIRSEVDIRSIQHALEAISLLSHKQHVEILLVVREIVNRGPEVRKL
jgi:Heavy-metal resistance